MKITRIILLLACLLLFLSSCTENEKNNAEITKIKLSDELVSVNGKEASRNSSASVYTANDIVYYEAGKGIEYGEGTEKDAHSAEEAKKHTVVHIQKAGTYSVEGTLSLGQIAIDLGEDAKQDPNAVVTLILNGVNINCKVAPAIIFYQVYECAEADSGSKGAEVNTEKAGANVILADGSENTVNGSYVAKIYKPDSVEFNAEGTEIKEAKKLHKYDGAFYSKMSMNLFGEKEGNGVLNIHAENEGLDSEMHLTVHGGRINIVSGNDGINTNEDGVSVTTIKGGVLKIRVSGETGEGDGIDSNGYLVVEGGSVFAFANSDSADSGIDSDLGILLRGGEILATGNMLDRIENSGQNFAVFQFAEKQNQNATLLCKDKNGNAVFEHVAENAFTNLIYSSPDLKEGEYTLYSDHDALCGKADQSGMGFGNPPINFDQTPPEMPEGNLPPEMPENQKPPQGMQPPFENRNEAPQKPDFSELSPPPEMPNKGDLPNFNSGSNEETESEIFTIKNGGNYFSNIQKAK